MQRPLPHLRDMAVLEAVIAAVTAVDTTAAQQSVTAAVTISAEDIAAALWCATEVAVTMSVPAGIVAVLSITADIAEALSITADIVAVRATGVAAIITTTTIPTTMTGSVLPQASSISWMTFSSASTTATIGTTAATTLAYIQTAR